MLFLLLLLRADKDKIKYAENFKMNEDDLFIYEIYVNEGPTLKRFKPRARGRATRIRKRTSHITVCVSDGKKEEA